MGMLFASGLFLTAQAQQYDFLTLRTATGSEQSFAANGLKSLSPADRHTSPARARPPRWHWPTLPACSLPPPPLPSPRSAGKAPLP